MFKKKRLLIGSALVLASAAVVATAISCSDFNTTTLFSRVNAKLENIRYDNEHSASYGSIDTGAYAAYRYTGGFLFRTKAEGNAEYDVTTGLVTKISQSYYQMVYADKIILTLADGSTVEYDNDAHEIDAEINTETNAASGWATSANEKSINNITFMQNLAKAVKFQISVKSGIKYYKFGGEETKYEVVARDYWYSWMRTRMLTSSVRTALGGNSAIDSYLVTYGGVTTRFGTSQRFPNEYLYSLFLIDLTKMNEESSFITTDSAGTSYVTFDSVSSTTAAKFDEFFAKLLINNADLYPAPSQYLDENYESLNASLDLPSTTSINNETIDVPAVTGLAAKMSIYGYGYTNESLLFAGAYYLEKSNTVEGLQIYTKNNNYPDEDFVNDPTTINSIQLYYRLISDTTYQTQIFNDFISEATPSIAYSSLTDAQKNNATVIDSLRYVVDLQNKQMYMRGVQVSTPATTVNNFNYYNDTYSKIMYGATKEELAKGTVTTWDTFYNGTGLRFRSILESAINWEYINDARNGGTTGVAWRSAFAPDANLGGSDQATAAYQTLRESTPSDIANSTFLLDSSLTKTATSVPSANNALLANGTSKTELAKSTIYEQAKALMSALLDEMGITGAGAVQWQIIHSSAVTPSTQQQSAYDSIIELVNGLDSRLKVSLFATTTTNDLYNAFVYGNGTSDFSGWGYDYNGSGTGFDSLAHHDSTSMMGAFGIYIDKDATSSTNAFPRFTELSQAIQTAIDNGTFLIKTHNLSEDGKTYTALTTAQHDRLAKVTNWDTITNAEGNDLEGLFSGYVLKSDVTYEAVDLATEFAKFFLTYQGTITNEQLANLISEFTVLLGGLNIPVSATERTVSKPTPNPLVINPYYETPITVQGVLDIQDYRAASTTDESTTTS